MIDFEAARAILLSLPPRVGTEVVSLAQAGDRVLARPVFAATDMPRHLTARMDGYAVRNSDLVRRPARLRVMGPVLPGQTALPDVPAGCCVRVFTGSRIPAYMDRVVVQKDVGRDGNHALFADAPSPRRHVRPRGSDFSAGDRVLATGVRVDARGIAVLAAADAAEATVYRRPTVAIIATGDDLCAPGQARATDNGVPDSVSLAVEAVVHRWGGVCVHRTRLPEVLHRLEAAAAAALAMADLVVVAGGASFGDKDYARRMFDALGLEILFSKVAIKPAKPVWLGKAAGKLVFGLPGNPASAMVAARLFLAPLLERIGGSEATVAAAWMQAPLAEPLPAGGDRERFVCANWARGAVVPLPERGSGARSATIGAELLLRLRAQAPAQPAGALVDAVAL